MLIPELWLIHIFTPIAIKIATKQNIHLRGDPGEGMDAVSDVFNGDLIGINAWPEELPHLARYGSM